MALITVIQKNRLVTVIVLATAIKTVLMTITPLSLDLSYMISQGLRTNLASTPYGYFLELTVKAWQLLPIDHPALSTVWTLESFQPSPALYLLVFMVKAPLLALDLLTGITLYKIVLGEGFDQVKARAAFYLWYLNPYVFLINEALAAVDLLPSLLLLISLAAITQKDQSVRGATAFAAATAAKLFPIVLLPTFLTLGKRKASVSLLAGIVGSAGYFAWVIFTRLDPWVALLHYGMFTQFFDQFVLSSGNKMIGLSFFSLTVVYVLIANSWPKGTRPMLDALLVTLLAFFAFSSGFPQYLLWLIPFLVLDVVMSRRPAWYLVILMSSAFILNTIAFSTYFTANANSLFFIPANTQFIKTAVASYLYFTRLSFSTLVIEPVAQAVFTATSLLYVGQLVEGRTGALSRLLRSFTPKQEQREN